MDQPDWLAAQFEERRRHLQAVAYRMLGSWTEADDAVQEAWLRLSRSDAGCVENLGGWLTTVVARVCLDSLRLRKLRREEPLDKHVAQPVVDHGHGLHPEHSALLADSVGLALLTVLETLEPAERVAFVLHDMFDLPFDEIATIVGRSSVATRQLASRARRRVRGATPVSDVDRARQGEIVRAFLNAAHRGDFHTLLALLDPDVVIRPDAAAIQMGVPADIRGASAVAETFSMRGRGAQLALVNGMVGLVAAHSGQTRAVFEFTITRGKITEISMFRDPDRIRQSVIDLLEE